MFTLRFESDSRGSGDDGLAFVICAPQYRVVRHHDGSADVKIENENGVEIAHVVADSLGAHSRCYVMNAAGATVDKIRPRQPSPQSAALADPYPVKEYEARAGMIGVA